MKKIVVLRIPLRHISLHHGNRPSPTYGPTCTQRSSLMSGLKVVGAKLEGALMSACTIMFQAGSRFESITDYGATHFLRVASAASGDCHTKFMKARLLAQNGAALTCRSDRQTITFSLRCPVGSFTDLKSYLLDTASRCCYHNWDIDDLRSVVRNSLVYRHPEERVLDLLQRACWRGPISNSVFCEPERINSITGDKLKEYANYAFQPACCTVASYGISFEEIMSFAECLEAIRPKPAVRICHSCSAARSGYETEDLGPGSTTWIAVGIPGCGSCDLQTLLILNIIAAACGIGNNQMSQHREDRVLSMPLGNMAGNDIFTDYKAFNISYSDLGVFGILARTRACSAWQVTMSAAEFLGHIGELNFKQICIGKERLKLGLALSEEDCVTITEGLALQLANDMQIDTMDSLICMIDSITPGAVSCVAQKLSQKRGEMALAVVGDVTSAPHEKEISCK